AATLVAGATAPACVKAGRWRPPPCRRIAGNRPLQPGREWQLLAVGRSRSCPRAVTPCRRPRCNRSPLCRRALVAAGRPLASGRAMPCCPSSSWPLL
ncbi:hypothetical protein B296_00051300, partial [Ensete ventricosum]